MDGTAIAIRQFMLSDAAQPDQLLFVCQPGEVVLFQRCREDLKGEILSVLPGGRVESRVGEDVCGIAFIERLGCALEL